MRLKKMKAYTIPIDKAILWETSFCIAQNSYFFSATTTVSIHTKHLSIVTY